MFDFVNAKYNGKNKYKYVMCVKWISMVVKYWDIKTTWGGIVWYNAINVLYCENIENHAYCIMWGKYVGGDWAPRSKIWRGRESQI